MHTKSKFIAALETFVIHEGRKTIDGATARPVSSKRGQVVLMRGVLSCLRSTPESVFTPWTSYLDRFLLDAFDTIRTTPDFAPLRAAYLAETGATVPDLYEIHVGGFYRSLDIYALTYLCGVLANDRMLCGTLESTFNAQAAVVDQAWRRFVAKAYRPFMARINAESHRSNAGQFGSTLLMTFACAGRVMFTFSRDDDSEDGSETAFIADDGDPVGIRSGANFSSTRYDLRVAMIEEVTRLWSIDMMEPAASGANL